LSLYPCSWRCALAGLMHASVSTASEIYTGGTYRWLSVSSACIIKQSFKCVIALHLPCRPHQGQHRAHACKFLTASEIYTDETYG
jgi:hypothetical protein